MVRQIVFPVRASHNLQTTVGRHPISELDLTASEFQPAAESKNIMHQRWPFDIDTLHDFLTNDLGNR